MVPSDPELVAPQVGSDQQHRGARCSEHIGDQSSKTKQGHIFPRRRLAAKIEMDATCYDKQRSDQRDEADVVVKGQRKARGVFKDHEIVRNNDKPQANRHSRISPLPPLAIDERDDSD